MDCLCTLYNSNEASAGNTWAQHKENNTAPSEYVHSPAKTTAKTKHAENKM